MGTIPPHRYRCSTLVAVGWARALRRHCSVDTEPLSSEWGRRWRGSSGHGHALGTMCRHGGHVDRR